ncbi:hypothetical protein [Nostoc sp. ATCC 53789]|uniref:hypothetical protein n=1 Tax=Nostoc sp. ATCC 53789 TaxID=76335 RepID=UPI000DECEC62|nr:hypothetical protein [Nostoc sp. ATCC 53789]QHG19342.1 hypothetical protein GJB62_27540 [Nostoc sp. ATCC 53789]RCJ27860.1 hypothetical protein A6V25_17150 [Nostoc sp. ATCC 53789]
MAEDSIEQIEAKFIGLQNNIAQYKEIQEKTQLKINSLENDIKQLKKQQDHLRTESYKDYYFTRNQGHKIIHRLSETLEQEGTILEMKALNDFRSSGYDAYEYFYIDTVTSKSRQIDIVAHKELSFKIEETNTKVFIKLWVVADCKFKSQIDLLCFNLGMNQGDILNFPKFIASDYRFNLSEVFDQNLLITSKITQLVMNAKGFPRNKLSKKTNHRGAEGTERWRRERIVV